MPRCAFLTMADIHQFECYDHLLHDPLTALGWDVTSVPWRRETDWDDFDVVVIRSPWDYQDEPAAFLQTLEKIEASAARLENPLEVVRWNIDKHYLQTIEQAGIPIVPTLWRDDLEPANIDDFFSHFDSSEIIIKPTLSANADDTFRLKQPLAHDTKLQLAKVFDKRAYMVQPFLKSICTEGEYSLFYFGGTYSHTICKIPAAGDFRVQEEHGGRLRRVEPTADMRQLGTRCVRAIPKETLYARVDFVRGRDRELNLIELELIEPSLYFNMDPASPQRFAGIFNQWMDTNL